MDTALNVLKVLVVLLEVVLLFNLLIVVHELGHFLAARWRGLVVEQFAVWFGKPLWKRTYNGVLYSLGSIPFGGFVKLPQMAPMDAIEGASDADREQLPTISPLDKIIVAIAGPLFSLGLAFVFAVIVWGIGRPVSEGDATKVLGYVLPDSPAANAPSDTPGVPPGLKPGDEILEVDDHPVKHFGGMNRSVVWYVVRSEGETIPFKVRRGGGTLTFRPKPLVQEAESGWRRKGFRQVLIDPAYSSIVKSVNPGSPGKLADLRENDIITAINGEKLWNPLALIELEPKSYSKPIDLTVQRGDRSLHVALTVPFKISEVLPGSPAAKAGLKNGDIITTIDGATATKFADLKAAVLNRPTDQPIELGISRGGKESSVSVQPVKPVNPKDGKDPVIGIAQDDNADGIAWIYGGKTALIQEKPLDQITGSVSGIFNTIGAVLAPKSGIKLQHLGGPVLIVGTYFDLLSRQDGWRLALWFSVVLNVNLALLNMLPIPVLDGGHILLAVIESIRRKPVNLRLLEVVQTACFIVIASYMLYVTFYDVGDRVSPGRKHREIEFPSPTPPSAQPK